MQRLSPTAVNDQLPRPSNPSPLTDIEKREKRRLALLMLIIALTLYLGAEAIAAYDGVLTLI